MSRSSNLYALQKTDSQIDQHKKRLREIAVILADRSAIEKAEAQSQQTQSKLDEGQKALRSDETKVKDQRLKIEQNEATLYSGKIRNPKELKDLQDEVAALKRYLEVLEERQLEAMLHVDDVRSSHEEAHGNLKAIENKTEQLHRDLLTEKTEIEGSLTNLGSQRQSCLSAIIAEDLQIYEQLRQQRAGIAVAKVNDRACSACGATLNAAHYQTARSPSQITNCQTCGRILYAV